MCKLFRGYPVSLHVLHVLLQLCGIVLKKRSFDASRELMQWQSLAALFSVIYVKTLFTLRFSNIIKSIRCLQYVRTVKDCACRKTTAYGRKVKLIQFWPLIYDPCLFGLQSLRSAGSQSLCHVMIASISLLLILVNLFSSLTFSDYVCTFSWGSLSMSAPIHMKTCIQVSGSSANGARGNPQHQTEDN